MWIILITEHILNICKSKLNVLNLETIDLKTPLKNVFFALTYAR